MFCKYLVLQKEKAQLKVSVAKSLLLLICFMRNVRNTSLFSTKFIQCQIVSKLLDVSKLE